MLPESISTLDNHDIAFINEVLDIDKNRYGFLNDYNSADSLVSTLSNSTLQDIDPMVVPLVGLMAPVIGNISDKCKLPSRGLVKDFFGNPMDSILAKSEFARIRRTRTTIYDNHTTLRPQCWIFLAKYLTA